MVFCRVKVVCLVEAVFLVMEDFLEEGVFWACSARAVFLVSCRVL